MSDVQPEASDVQPEPSWWQRWRLRILIVLVAVVAFILIWWLLPLLLYSATSDEPTRVKAITDTRTALLAGLVGIGALGTFWMNSQNVKLSAQNVRLSAKTLGVTEENSRLAKESQQHTVKDATERRVTELYTKAADQLGSDKAPVRQAGLYALERLAQDNKSQRQTIVNVICAYLQMPYTAPGTTPVEPSDAAYTPPGTTPVEPSDAALMVASEKRAEQERERYEKRLHKHEERTQEQRVRITAQQILLRHISRRADKKIRWKIDIDLRQANLTRALLGEADLTGAYLLGANLTEAYLGDADLTEASLGMVNLTGANLSGAVLTGATLLGVIWTEDTTWPHEVRDTIKAVSDDVSVGVDRRFRIQKQVRLAAPSPLPGSGPSTA